MIPGLESSMEIYSLNRCCCMLSYGESKSTTSHMLSMYIMSSSNFDYE